MTTKTPLFLSTKENQTSHLILNFADPAADILERLYRGDWSYAQDSLWTHNIIRDALHHLLSTLKKKTCCLHRIIMNDPQSEFIKCITSIFSNMAKLRKILRKTKKKFVRSIRKKRDLDIRGSLKTTTIRFPPSTINAQYNFAHNGTNYKWPKILSGTVNHRI